MSVYSQPWKVETGGYLEFPGWEFQDYWWTTGGAPGQWNTLSQKQTQHKTKQTKKQMEQEITQVCPLALICVYTYTHNTNSIYYLCLRMTQ